MSVSSPTSSIGDQRAGSNSGEIVSSAMGARLDRGRGGAGVRLQRNALEPGVEAFEPGVHQGDTSVIAELQLVES